MLMNELRVLCAFVVSYVELQRRRYVGREPPDSPGTIMIQMIIVWLSQ
jgi:hypothetical protein